MLAVVRQTTRTDCAAACLTMVLKGLGAKVDLTLVRDAMSSSVAGASVRSILDCSSKFGCLARALSVKVADLNRVKLPAILHWELNHFVVLSRIIRGNYEIIDPGRGRVLVTREELELSYTGILVETVTSKLSPVEDPLQKAPKKRSLSYLLSANASLLGPLILAILLSVAVQALGVAVPIAMGALINNLAAGEVVERNLDIIVAILAMGAFQASGEYLRRNLLLEAGLKLGLRFGERVYNHLFQLPLSFFQRRRLNDVISRAESAQTVRDILVEGAAPILIDGLFAVGLFAVVSSMSIQVALTSASIWLFYLIIRVLSAASQVTKTHALLEAQSAERGSIIETVRAIQTIKVTASEGRRLEDWYAKSRTMVSASRCLQRLNASITGLKQLLSGLDALLSIAIAALLLQQHLLSLGALIAVTALRQQFQDRIGPLVDRVMEMNTLRVHLARLDDISTAQLESRGDPLGAGAAPVREVEGPERDNVIVVKDLTFAYSALEGEILKSASLFVRRGEMVAITGCTGAGKSSLAKLILGINDEFSGCLSVLGVAPPSSNIAQVRMKTSAVMQQDELFSGSVLDNITCFETRPDLELVHRAAEVACVDEDLLKLPMGFYTPLGDIGLALSGGQKQRLLIARAVYRQPELLVLDEGTANLDAECEERVLANLKALKITIVGITHRPATVVAADRHYHLADGCFREIEHDYGSFSDRGVRLAS